MKGSAKEESKKIWVSRKAKLVSNILDLSVDQSTEHGRELADRVLKKVCKDRGMVVTSQEEQELKIWEVISYVTSLGMVAQMQLLDLHRAFMLSVLTSSYFPRV